MWCNWSLGLESVGISLGLAVHSRWHDAGNVCSVVSPFHGSTNHSLGVAQGSESTCNSCRSSPLYLNRKRPDILENVLPCLSCCLEFGVKRCRRISLHNTFHSGLETGVTMQFEIECNPTGSTAAHIKLEVVLPRRLPWIVHNHVTGKL